jgi:hypothetical protein
VGHDPKPEVVEVVVAVLPAKYIRVAAPDLRNQWWSSLRRKSEIEYPIPKKLLPPARDVLDEHLVR